MGSKGKQTQKVACLGFSSDFTFPLVVGLRRAADRLTELRDRDIGSLALGDPFSPNLGVFGEAKRDIIRISLRTGIETRAHLESTRKRALH